MPLVCRRIRPHRSGPSRQGERLTLFRPHGENCRSLTTLVSGLLPVRDAEAYLDEALRSLAEQTHENLEVIIVDDGSRDRTGSIADALTAADARIRVVHNQPNRGYGGALLAGFAAASKPLTFFMDADGQFDIGDLARLLPLCEQGYQAVLGYRRHRQDHVIRRLNAFGWSTLVALLLGLRVRDIDCAFKLYDTTLVRAFAVESEGAMINTEMLTKLTKLGIPYAQVPVHHYPRLHGKATGAQLRVIVHAFGELFRLRHRLRSWRATLPTGEESTGAL